MALAAAIPGARRMAPALGHIGMIVGAVFDKAFRKFTEAFEERARHVYGTSRAPLTPG